MLSLSPRCVNLPVLLQQTSKQRWQKLHARKQRHERTPARRGAARAYVVVLAGCACLPLHKIRRTITRNHTSTKRPSFPVVLEEIDAPTIDPSIQLFAIDPCMQVRARLVPKQHGVVAHALDTHAYTGTYSERCVHVCSVYVRVLYIHSAPLWVDDGEN